jgi:hypothetical protein
MFLALKKQSKTWKYKEQALSGKRNTHASVHFYVRANKIDCFINNNKIFYLQFATAY